MGINVGTSGSVGAPSRGAGLQVGDELGVPLDFLQASVASRTRPKAERKWLNHGSLSSEARRDFLGPSSNTDRLGVLVALRASRSERVPLKAVRCKVGRWIRLDCGPILPSGP